MKDYTHIIDAVIDSMELEAAEKDKHVLKTETIWNRTLLHIDTETGDEWKDDFIRLGLQQVIQSRLYVRGYRSIQTGYFVKVSTCQNIGYLKIASENADGNAKIKAGIAGMIRELLNSLAQIEMKFAGADFEDYIIPETSETLMEEIEADSV